MKKLNLKSNVEFIKYLMEYAPTGAMSQLFIITAIEKYSQLVLEAKEEDWPMGSFISFQSWQKTAEFLKKAIDERGQH